MGKIKGKTVGSAHTRELFEKSSTKNFYPKTALCAVFMVLFLLVACGGSGNGAEATPSPEPEPPPIAIEENFGEEIELEEIEAEPEEIETEEIEPEEPEIREAVEEMPGVYFMPFPPVDPPLSLLAERAINRTWERLYIPEGEAGAFDVGVEFSIGRVAEDEQEYLVRMDLGLRVESDGYRTETMVETTMDMGALMGSLFGGMDMNIAVFTATEGGETVESRLYMAGTEMNMDLFGGFDPAELVQIGDYSPGMLVGSMFEFLPQFSADELENLDIRYDRTGDYWTLWLSGIYIPMDFELAQSTMAAFGVDMGGVAHGEVLLAFDSYEHNPPHRIVAEIHWETDDAEYFMIFRVGIN
jgi:hypothetical protein